MHTQTEPLSFSARSLATDLFFFHPAELQICSFSHTQVPGGSSSDYTQIALKKKQKSMIMVQKKNVTAKVNVGKRTTVIKRFVAYVTRVNTGYY